MTGIFRFRGRTKHYTQHLSKKPHHFCAPDFRPGMEAGRLHASEHDPRRDHLMFGWPLLSGVSGVVARGRKTTPTDR
jgi:hypothetical protein